MDEDCIRHSQAIPDPPLKEKEQSEKKEAFLEIKNTTAKINN